MNYNTVFLRIFFLLNIIVAVLSIDNKSVCNSIYDCLKYNVGKALNRIELSDNFTVLSGLKFDRMQKTEIDSENLNSLNDYDNDDKNITEIDLIKKAENLFKTHKLLWNFLPGVDMILYKDQLDQFTLRFSANDQTEGRTFGFRRKMKMALLPIMYKLGVITTLLAMLTVFTMKGLAIGILLLVLSGAGFLAKFKFPHAQHSWSYDTGWSHSDHHSPHKEIHVHVHPYGSHSYSGGPPPSGVHPYEWSRNEIHANYPSDNVASRSGIDWKDIIDITNSAPHWKYLPT